MGVWLVGWLGVHMGVTAAGFMQAPKPYADAHTHIHRHTDTQTHRHKDTQTHRHTDTHTCTHTQAHTLT